MALEKQAAFNEVSLQVRWPDPPEAVTVIGPEGKVQVIPAEAFTDWALAMNLSLQAQFDATAREIEQLKAVSK